MKERDSERDRERERKRVRRKEKRTRFFWSRVTQRTSVFDAAPFVSVRKIMYKIARKS